MKLQGFVLALHNRPEIVTRPAWRGIEFAS